MAESKMQDILTFIRMCAESDEESKDDPKLKVGMWERKLTLKDLRDHADRIPQQRIQEENVRYGMARCKAEAKEKSIRKLKEFLMSHPNAEYVSEAVAHVAEPEPEPEPQVVYVKVDDDVTIQVTIPQNKTKTDLFSYIYSFRTSTATSKISYVLLDNKLQIKIHIPMEKSKEDLIAHISNF